MHVNRNDRQLTSQDAGPGQIECSREREVTTPAIGLVQQLSLFDATMLVMGGVIGTGIFIVPELVARQVHTAPLIIGAWLLGGLVAVCGGLVYAELTARYPEVGGQYAYLREAYHPMVAFLFGWSLLLVMQTGAIASVAMIFARYFIDLSQMPLKEGFVAATAISFFTLINCFGVRTGATIQSAFMVTKIGVICLLGGCGLFLGRAHSLALSPGPEHPASADLLTAMGGAMIPILFTYSGWQAAGFVSAEVRNPRRNMPLATVFGVLGVITLYCLVTIVDLRVLGPEVLAHTDAPASAVMRTVLGERGGTIIAVGIMIAALGYISQAVLTAPRVYYAMAMDKVFFRSFAWLPRKSHVPILAILLQGICAVVIAFSGKYEQVLTYVMSVEFVFFCLTGASLFIFRRRTAEAIQKGAPGAIHATRYEMPGHPFTTLVFILVSAAVSLNMFRVYPLNTLLGFGIVLSGIPVYLWWHKRNCKHEER